MKTKSIRYELLLAKIKELGMTQEEFAYTIEGMTGPMFSRRIHEECPFTLPEMYHVLDALNMDYSNLHLVFPRGGATA